MTTTWAALPASKMNAVIHGRFVQSSLENISLCFVGLKTKQKSAI